MTASSPATAAVRAVEGEDWVTLAWLWQCFRQDLAPVVAALPHADGRYSTTGLPTAPSPGVAAYLATRPHPGTGDAAPVAFAVVDGLSAPRRALDALWVAPAARGAGLGRWLVLDVLGRHPGPWSIAFQHDNTAAGRFWRSVAEAAFGTGGWSEERRAVPHRRGAPPDHWIESRRAPPLDSPRVRRR